MLKWTISIMKNYLKPFNCVQIELSMFDRNTWNHLSVCK